MVPLMGTLWLLEGCLIVPMNGTLCFQGGCIVVPVKGTLYGRGGGVFLPRVTKEMFSLVLRMELPFSFLPGSGAGCRVFHGD